MRRSVSRWQAVVFDLDDTLYPERDYVLSGFRVVAAWAETHLQIPRDQGFAELEALFAQGVRGDTFNRWLEAHQLPAQPAVNKLVRLYREHLPELTPFPEVGEVLTVLRSRYLLGLVSDGWIGVQRRKMASLKLGPFFHAIVLSDEWGREAWKPSAKPFEVLVQRLGVDPARTVYVGDNPVKDFLGCRQLGLFGVRVRRTGLEYTGLEPPTAAHAPHAVITSLNGLMQQLSQMEEG